MDTKNRFLILTGGRLSKDFLAEFLKGYPASKIICIDGALAAAHEAGIPIDYLVGDFDTVEPSLLAAYKKEIELGSKTIQLREYNPVKDATDTQIGISLALEEGAGEIVLLGAIGTRMDHTLANLQLLLKPLSCGIRAYIFDEYNKIYLADRKFQLWKKDLYGPYVSMLPFGGDVKAVTLQGFKYNVVKQDYVRGDSLGVSNELIGETAQVAFEDGVLAVFETKDAY